MAPILYYLSRSYVLGTFQGRTWLSLIIAMATINFGALILYLAADQDARADANYASWLWDSYTFFIVKYGSLTYLEYQ